ncbi:glutamate receptor ionotropic, kainate 4-like isoform X2 [Nilaparvata lugens]|uniref:glutamate receptor ionotropic, kainate 4-like isoform X2 n=1 Tax=Nilaparvata lugens TaxID=108931 RepID=UPI00193E1E98|nr:glutamate receptor ionotropic, kainate 4-like isoform X2 [Nilaparvata lugens]
MNDITHDEGRFGIKLGNGSWTGAIRELINGKSDVFYCGLWINLQRAEAIGFTSPLLQQEITFFVPLERGLQWSWISLFLPFTATVWVIAFTVFFLLTFVLYVAAHITKYCPSLQRISFLPTPHNSKGLVRFNLRSI